MRGRKPKPTALKLIEGNPGRRPIRGSNRGRRGVQPTCPAHLSPTAKAEWKRLAQTLNVIGLLTQVDRAALALARPRPIGRGRAQAHRDASAAEDARRLRPAVALARHRQQAAGADGEVGGPARPNSVVAQPAGDPDAHRAEAVGNPRRVGVRLTHATGLGDEACAVMSLV